MYNTLQKNRQQVTAQRRHHQEVADKCTKAVIMRRYQQHGVAEYSIV
jgi:hypothetical protein